MKPLARPIVRTALIALAVVLLALVAIFGRQLSAYWTQLDRADQALGVLACLILAGCSLALVCRRAE